MTIPSNLAKLRCLTALKCANAFAIAATCASLCAQDATNNPAPRDTQNAQTVNRGINYLLTKGRSSDGSYSSRTGAGVTAICTTALLRHGRSPNDPAIAKSLRYLEQLVQKDGGIYAAGSTHKNYETCLALVCFLAANENHRFDKVIKDAEDFIKRQQWDEGEGHDRSSLNYGGAGYGGKSRPDLSNTSFLIDALQAAGNGPDDPALRRALFFVSRCQNMESEHNTSPFAAKINDGGFYYTVAAGGESPAKQPADPPGALRSYGSMTYAGLKSMIYAGLDKNDPRVKAATAWLRKHYTLDANPGMADAGLYYYLHAMAKALDALGNDVFEDAEGRKHRWGAEITQALAERQNDDGSWTNKNSRWLESDANLVTGYALLTLAYAR